MKINYNNMKRELKQLIKYLVTIVVAGSAGVSAGVGFSIGATSSEWKLSAFLFGMATLIAVLFSIEPVRKLKRSAMLLLFATLLLSCGRHPADFSEDSVVITDVEQYDNGDESQDGCLYYTQTTKRYTVNRLLVKAYFYDRCGKFTVGDTVKTVKK